MVVAEAQQDRQQDEADDQSVKRDGHGEDDSHLLRGSGPDRAKVRNTAIMTAAADKTTRPELRTEPTMACSGSAWVS